VAADDAFGALTQFHGRLPVVGTVTHVIAQDALGFTVVTFGGGDRGQVQSRDLLVGGCAGGQLGGGTGACEIPVREPGGGDHVGDVDDGAEHVLVESVALVQP
jgi:hypothetical protein